MWRPPYDYDLGQYGARLNLTASGKASTMQEWPHRVIMRSVCCDSPQADRL